MDRERALQYFKQRGLGMAPAFAQWQSDSLAQRDLQVAGDGIGLEARSSRFSRCHSADVFHEHNRTADSGHSVLTFHPKPSTVTPAGHSTLTLHPKPSTVTPAGHSALTLHPKPSTVTPAGHSALTFHPKGSTVTPAAVTGDPLTVCTACTCRSQERNAPTSSGVPSLTPRASFSALALMPSTPTPSVSRGSLSSPSSSHSSSPLGEGEGEGEGGSGSEEDSDDEGLSLDSLLAMMSRFALRVTSPAASATLLRLASCLSPTQSLSEHHINQLMTHLESDSEGETVLREATLQVVQRLLALNWGWSLVSSGPLLDRVMGLMGPSSPATVQVLAMGVLDKLLNVPELDFGEVRERLGSEVYPVVLGYLRCKAPLTVQTAACCLLRSLARDLHFAARIQKESLFLLRQLKHSSARLREAYVGVLTAMFSHPGLTETGSVDTSVLPVIKGLLRDGPCETQRGALGLLHVVMGDHHGVEAVTADQRIVAYVLACLTSSLCRHVRAQASEVADALTAVKREGVARRVLEGIHHYMHSRQDPEAKAAAGGGPAKGTRQKSDPVPAKHQAEVQAWHSADCFLDSVAHLLRSEGLVVGESDRLQSELPLRGEVGGTQLRVVSRLLHLVVNVCTWPLTRRAVGHGNAQVSRLDVTHLCQDPALRQKFQGLNHRLAVLQWKRFGPTVSAILRWMSQRVGTHLPPPDLFSASPSRDSIPPNSSALVPLSRPASAKTVGAGSAPKVAVRPSSAKPPVHRFPSEDGSKTPGADHNNKLRSGRHTLTRPASAQPVTSHLRPPGASNNSGDTCRPASARLSEGGISLSCRGVGVVLREAVGEGEWGLVLSLLDAVLCMTLLTCRTLPDPLADPPPPPPSSSSADRHPADARKGRQSPKGLWVSENPHLTGSRGHDPEVKSQDSLEREAASDRKSLRRDLVNQGFFAALAPLIRLDDPEVKTRCSLILRAAVQPLDEKVQQSRSLPSKGDNKVSKVGVDRAATSFTSFGQSSRMSDTSNYSRPLSRASSAGGGRGPQSGVNAALHKKSTSSAAVVRDAWGSPLPPKSPGVTRPASASSQVSTRVIRPGSAYTEQDSAGCIRPLSAATGQDSTGFISPASAFTGQDSAGCVRPASAATRQDSTGFINPSSASVEQDSDWVIRPTSPGHVVLSRAASASPSAATSVFSNLSVGRSPPDNTADRPAPGRCPRLLVKGQPINKACQSEAVSQCGGCLLQSLFSRSHGAKLYTLLFLLDLVNHSGVELHMELSKLGIIPKLLDFIRINSDKDELQIVGLRVLQRLVSSDNRLRQLFSRHGGHTLLMALTPRVSSEVRQEVRATMAAVTRGQSFEGEGHRVRGQRPSSAPTKSMLTMAGAPQYEDIWDHIVQRWAQEDNVVTVLQKYM